MSAEFINVEDYLKWELNSPIKHELIASIADIQVLRRSEGWIPKHYFLGDDISFEFIKLTLSVEEIYYRVQNEDVMEFLNNKMVS